MQYSVCSLFPNRPHLSSERETRRQVRTESRTPAARKPRRKEEQGIKRPPIPVTKQRTVARSTQRRILLLRYRETEGSAFSSAKPFPFIRKSEKFCFLPAKKAWIPSFSFPFQKNWKNFYKTSQLCNIFFENGVQYRIVENFNRLKSYRGEIKLCGTKEKTTF